MIRILIFLVAGAGLVYVTTSQLSKLPLSSINPDSKIYFVDNLSEKLKLLTLNDPEEKIGKLLDFSDEKMEEVNYILGGDFENKAELLEKVLPQHEKYIEEALEQIETIKEENSGSSSAGSVSLLELEKKISNEVLEKKEILSQASINSSEGEKETLEKEIEKTEIVVQKIIEKVEGPVKEMIVYKTEKIDEAIEDKKEEEEIKQQEEIKEFLTDSEKIYNLWIDNLYSKTLPKVNEPFFIRAHIRRRDDECKFFGGKVVLKIMNGEWQEIITRLQPYDDLWLDLGPIELSKGEYIIEGRVMDNSGRVISTKTFETIID